MDEFHDSLKDVRPRPTNEQRLDCECWYLCSYSNSIWLNVDIERHVNTMILDQYSQEKSQKSS